MSSIASSIRSSIRASIQPVTGGEGEQVLSVSVAVNDAVVNDVNCIAATGSLVATIKNGVAPYTIQWTKLSGDGTIVSPTAATTDISFTDVCPQEQLSGTYQIQVTDAESTVVTAQATITAFNEAVLPLSLTMDSADGTAESETPVNINSTVSVAVSGGVTPYSYSWAKVSGDGTIVSGGTTDTATVEFANVAPEDTPSGTFEVTVTDNQGAVATNTVSVAADNTFVTNPFPTGKAGYFFDTSDLSTMYQDAAGTIPVTAAGQPVGRWEDKSGNGYILTQTTSTKRPIYQTDGTRHWLVSNGIDTHMVSVGNVLVNSANTIELFAGIKFNNLSDVRMFAYQTASNRGFRAYHKGGNVSFYVQDTTFIETQTTLGTTNPVNYKGLGLAYPTFVESGCYVNGAGNAQATGVNNGSGFFGDAPLNLFASSSGAIPVNGNLYSLIFVAGGLTAQERSNINNFITSSIGQ